MKKIQSLKKKHIVLICVLLVVLAIGVWIFWTNTNIIVSHISIKNEKIPKEFENFKIAQVSDLHNHQWGNKLIDRLEKERPNIIVITGDLVDSSHTDFDIAMEFINKSLKIAPIYYVTGNHEAWLQNYNELQKRLEDAGVNMMDDRNEWLEKGDAKINLIGIKDPDFVERSSFDYIEESIVMTKLEPLLNKDFYNIVLCHRPEVFESYVSLNVDLVITGHAHGGQFRIPFVGGLIAPNQGFFPKYTKGLYSKDKTDMVVSRGLGNSIIPVRINNTPELVVITLKDN